MLWATAAAEAIRWDLLLVFEEILVTSGGGGDLARIYDSPANDTVSASIDQVVFTTGPSNSGLMRKTATAEGFASSVAYKVWGGTDTLTLLDSPADEKVVLRSHKAELGPRGADEPVFTGRGFDMVHAMATAGHESGGYDYVRIHDTNLVDHLIAGFQNGKSWVQLSDAAIGKIYYDATGFGVVRAVNDYGDSPRNTKKVDAAVDFLLLDGGWDEI